MSVHTVSAPILGTVVSIDVEPGDVVRPGQAVAVIESMKMEHVVTAESGGMVAEVTIGVGSTVAIGDALLTIVPTVDATAAAETGTAADNDDIASVRADVDRVLDRHERTRDERRPDAVARRHDSGHRTARENIAALLDPGSFVEYGPLVVAARRRRSPLEELIERTPADGLVGGTGTIDGRAVVVMSYDYTVLAGTQGLLGHEKKDRLFELAERRRLPVVFFTEGGGGRPGDTDGLGVTGLDCLAFHSFARLSGSVPLVGVASGFCFAGNAAILGCCDVVIGVAGTNIAMGGPAMIEGGGLGVYEPTEIGPFATQVANGVIDVAVDDDPAAVTAAKQYLAYFGGVAEEWSCEDQQQLRRLVPENRSRVYDVRKVIDTLCDTGSVLELRRGWGAGMVTALTRVEGRPLGVVANDPAHLGGAIDVDAADKAARFLQLCDAFDLPVVFLCDTPGFMVGPEHEERAAVRHVSRMFVTGANLTVPFGTIVLRKGYGLGAQAMAGGSFKAPWFCVAWPTGEFGGMNIEGAVRLGRARELNAITDPHERERQFRALVQRMYEDGSAVNVAMLFEIDDAIDPADSRTWIKTLLVADEPRARHGKKRPNIDTW
ncbi:MAG TPA: carboxyl transferase domain-containing protein [Acidimicrobiia bacterium]|nr:carboxyl transferase domain-containing protein [Acidimicrobiia bacterium]